MNTICVAGDEHNAGKAKLTPDF